MAETEREIKKSAFVVISCLYYELLHEKIFVVLAHLSRRLTDELIG